MHTAEAVVSVIRDILKQPDLPILPQTTAQDVPGWDSFAMVKIIIGMQELFGIEFDTEELDDIRNVGDLIDMIEHHLPASND